MEQNNTYAFGPFKLVEVSVNESHQSDNTSENNPLHYPRKIIFPRKSEVGVSR